jgi:hypothetical protein
MIVSSTQGPGTHHGAGRAGDLIPFHGASYQLARVLLLLANGLRLAIIQLPL